MIDKIVSIALLLNSFICVVAMESPVTPSDPFEAAHNLYDQSKWEDAEEAYNSVFKETGALSDLSEEAIKKEAHSYGMTSAQFIRGHVNCGDVKMALGKVLQAFDHWRYRVYSGQFDRKPLANEWDGSDPRGKTIVVYSERDKGAFGDTFIMSFLLRWLKRSGANLIFVPQKPLKTLYSVPGTAQHTYVDKVVVRGEQIPDHDSSTYLWSVLGPYVKECKGSSFPVSGSWISGKKELPLWMQEKLREHAGKLLIGFWWRSSGATSKAADYRSLDRDPGANRMFKALRGIPGVKLICLEGMGHRPVSQEEYENLKRGNTLGNLDPIDITGYDPSEIITFDPEKFDKKNGAFVDTASVMQYVKKNRGLLVGCDTGLLALAAGIKEPEDDKPSTFAILNKQADMRWEVKGERRRWPLSDNVEIFQCPEQGKWEEPLGQVREEVKKRAEELASKVLT